jgi:S1-C subfamily serine protease
MSREQIATTWRPATVTVLAGTDRAAIGLVVDATGLIATTLHTVEGESNLRIKVHHDPREHPVAAIAGVDASRGIALLRIQDGAALPTVRFGDSSAVATGDNVFELGPDKVSEGSIAQVRMLSDSLTIFQVNAENAEEWSGPIFNASGDVVALAAAYLTPQKIVIAIPANYVRQLMAKPVSLSPDEFAKQTAKPRK